MNKDDIIKLTVVKNAGICNEDGIKSFLAWDESKSITHSGTDVTDLYDCELSTIGALWQEYGDEIVAYIQDKTIEDMKATLSEYDRKLVERFWHDKKHGGTLYLRQQVPQAFHNAFDEEHVNEVKLGLKDMPEENALTPTLTQLQDLLTWPDGWNSYDALAPNPENVSRATTWITEVYQHLISQKQPWIAPNITGGGDGEVVIHWYNGIRDITVYIDIEEKYMYYIKHQGKGITARLDDGEIEVIEDMQKLWQWLLETPQDKSEETITAEIVNLGEAEPEV